MSCDWSNMESGGSILHSDFDFRIRPLPPQFGGFDPVDCTGCFEPAVKGICLSTVVLISNRSIVSPFYTSSWIAMISRTALFISRPPSSFSQYRFASSLVFLEHKGGKLNDSSLNAVTAAKQVEGDVGLTCSSVSEIKCRGWVRADVCCRLRG